MMRFASDRHKLPRNMNAKESKNIFYRAFYSIYSLLTWSLRVCLVIYPVSCYRCKVNASRTYCDLYPVHHRCEANQRKLPSNMNTRESKNKFLQSTIFYVFCSY